MRNICFILFTVFLITTLGCASKKFAKQADKYAQAGMYRDAAEMYYRSVVANNKNLEARMGLQRNGQLLLQEKLDMFKTQYDNHAIKEAVYAYIDADQYCQTIKATGVVLIFPPENKAYFDEVKEKYLETRYAEALQALDVEEFAGAESVLSEIIKIDAAYKDSKTHWMTARYEPIYRRALAEFGNRLYRTAYYSFDEVIKGTGTYKDALNNKSAALDSAMITIAIVPFYTYNSYNNISTPLRNQIAKDLNQIKSPFYKVIADPVIATLPENGKKSRIYEIIPFLSACSKSITARAVLTGAMSKLNEETGDLSEVVKTGYSKSTVEYKDEKTGETKSKVEYAKVTYKEYTQTNSSTVAFEYSLIDVKKSMILVSDVFNINKSSETHYARYQGELSKLVPGYWKYADKDSPEDNVQDNQTSINQLKALINTPKDIKSVATLSQEAYAVISSSLVKSIEQYNPEK